MFSYFGNLFLLLILKLFFSIILQNQCDKKLVLAANEGPKSRKIVEY